jgi:hypothetical protein
MLKYLSNQPRTESEWFEKFQYELRSRQCSDGWLIEIVLHSMQQTDHNELALGSGFMIQNLGDTHLFSFNFALKPKDIMW